MGNIKKFEQFVNEELDGSTTASPGSGTAVGGGATGSFTSSAGQAVYGGDSGTAFATNSNTTGMGAIHSAQPSNTPGSVWGKDSISGSGDISKGKPLGPYTKKASILMNKRGKTRKEKYTEIGANIDSLYKPKYTETQSKGKLITKWKMFNSK